MDYQRIYLPQHQQEKLRDLLNSPDFILLIDCIKSEGAAAEVDASKVGIWREQSSTANQKAARHILNAQIAQSALSMFETMAKEDFQFSKLTITP
jgi:hypothetical protein